MAFLELPSPSPGALPGNPEVWDWESQRTQEIRAGEEEVNPQTPPSLQGIQESCPTPYLAEREDRICCFLRGSWALRL